MSVEYPSFLADLPESELLDAAYWMPLIELDYGTPLAEAGEEDPSLAIVLEGEISLKSNGYELPPAGPGRLVGDVELFGEQRRAATAKTVTPCRLLVIDRDGWLALRDQGNLVAWALERASIGNLALQLREANHAIEPLARDVDLGDDLPRHGGAAEWFARLDPRRWTGPGRRDWGDALLDTPAFAGLDRLAVDAVAGRLRPRLFAPGERLFEEGGPGDSAFIVVDGEVDVTMRCGKAGVEPMGELGPGAICGVTSLVTGKARCATGISRGRTVALELTRDDFFDLVAAPDVVGSALRTATIRALGAQVSSAHARLAMLHDAHRRTISAELAPLRVRSRLGEAEASAWSSSGWETA